jgi:hypothetical protein
MPPYLLTLVRTQRNLTLQSTDSDVKRTLIVLNFEI